MQLVMDSVAPIMKPGNMVGSAARYGQNPEQVQVAVATPTVVPAVTPAPCDAGSVAGEVVIYNINQNYVIMAEA